MLPNGMLPFGKFLCHLLIMMSGFSLFPKIPHHLIIQLIRHEGKAVLSVSHYRACQPFVSAKLSEYFILISY